MVKKKTKFRQAPAPNAAAKAKPNLFETLWTRRKFNVLGKKQKGEGKRVGLSRSRAIEKRKKTILQEYKQRNKTNSFVDRRFGENNEGMAEDEKSILRFQRERQIQLQKKSKFALPDVEDEEDELTHRGAALSSLDDFQDDFSADEDDELKEDTVKELNFGGGFSEEEGGPKVKRSKKEIMEEVIAKSKYFKSLRAKEKEEDFDLKEKLDKDFAELSKTPALISLVRPKKMNALKSLFAKNSEPSNAVDKIDSTENSEKDQADEYDKLVKSMAFEMRAHASERLKTVEEIAKEEKERLESLEEKRKKRMMGEQGDDSESEDDDATVNRKGKKAKMREISGDDLGENFVIEEEEKGWVDEVLARKAESLSDLNADDEDGDNVDDDDVDDDDDGDDDVDDDDGDGDDDDDVDDDDDDENLSDDDGAYKHEKQKRIKNESELKRNTLSKEVEVQQSTELPYVMDAPQSLQDLKEIVGRRSTEELLTAIQRIRACNAISLAAENRKKMQVFYNVLLLYFSDLAAQRPVPMERINVLTKPLIEMSSETPFFAAVCARERLKRMQNQLTSGGGWPSVRSLLLLRLWSLIFPASDFRHVVMTPATLVMGEYLLKCPVTCGRDIAVGVFLCSLALSMMRHARRFFPEALNFVLAVLTSGLTDKSFARKNCPNLTRELVAHLPWLRLKQEDESTSLTQIPHLSFTDLMSAEDDSSLFDDDIFRLGIMNSCVATVKGFADIYDDLPSFPEVFGLFFPVLLELSITKEIPNTLRSSIDTLLEMLKQKIDHHHLFRQPLRMRLNKPPPLKQFNPKFEEEYVKGRSYDPDRIRAEKKKLMKQVKREEKGAVRELRKDNHFLAAEREKERKQSECERDEKYKKAMAFLQEQESNAKSGQLGRLRKKRR